ncbi:MAG: hydroxyacylglutathione hydrolase [Holophagales bacterium]|nr:hydroxyacylglutathione hydrolase [Holophagales bacterium]MYC10160.1 hydroxyacylglutathione hydrolase [Holophagales bacterium]
MLEIQTIPVLSDNYSYVLHDTGSGKTAVVDPPETDPIEAALSASGFGIDWIVITHHHMDHIAAVPALKEKYRCQVVGPAADQHRIPGLDLLVREGDRFQLGEAEAQVFDTPGHTTGHITYWFEDDRALFCADTLFALGCGRVFEGTMEQMWESLAKLRALPDDAIVHCGHEYTLSNAHFAVTVDPDNEELMERVAEIEELRRDGKPTVPSNLGVEKRTNPFLRPDDAGIRAQLGMAAATNAEVFGEIRTRKDNS